MPEPDTRTEVQRALAYRQEAEARVRDRAAREKRMRGDPAAAAAINAAWAPLLPDEGWDAPGREAIGESQ